MASFVPVPTKQRWKGYLLENKIGDRHKSKEEDRA